MAQNLATIADALWLTEAEASLPQGSLRRIAVFSLLTILLGFGGLTLQDCPRAALAPPPVPFTH